MNVKIGLATFILTISACQWGEPGTPYTVIRGDTLSKIAKRHDVTVDELRSWNGLEGDLIEVGQVLMIHVAAAEMTVVPEPSSSPRPRRSGTAAADPIDEGPLANLSMPPMKDCMAGPSEVESEQGMAASEGLSAEQAGSAMRGFIQHTTGCVEGDVPAGTLELEVTVSCSGRVDRVTVASNPGWDGGIADCVTQVLMYAPFPAHALPDGDTFTYPLTFSH